MRIAVLALLLGASSIYAQTFSVDSLVSNTLPRLFQPHFTHGDVNADGFIDLAVSGNDTSGFPVMELFLGKGFSGFSQLQQNMKQLSNGASCFFDADNDNDLDFFITGTDSLGNPGAYLYINDNANFTDSGFALKGLTGGSCDWADFDLDGDSDLLLTGTAQNAIATTILYKNTGASFEEMTTVFPGVKNGLAEFSDVNGDGYSDIFLLGEDNASQPISALFSNNKGLNFNSLSAPTIGLIYSDADFGDYNIDGNPDLVVNGRASDSTSVSIVYRNDGTGVFSEIVRLRGLRSGTVQWGDANNNGLPDILTTGFGDSVAYAALYFNKGQDVFEESDSAFVGVKYGVGSFVDYDSDGDSDIMLVGQVNDSLTTSIVYQSQGVAANSVPSAPLGSANIVTPTSLHLSWQPASDAETDSLAISYNLRIGSAPGGHDLLSALSMPNGNRLLARRGNMGTRTYYDIPLNIVKGMPVLYWSVQAIDHQNAGSVFSPEQRFKQIFMLDSVATQGISSVNASATSWADYDLDGDYDLFISGQDNSNTRIAELYNNDGNGAFNKSSGQFEGVAAGATCWGDYDKDGDPDLLVSGITSSNQSATTIYQNNGAGGFTKLQVNIPGVYQSAAAWADYDNDGDLDLLLAGFTGAQIMSTVFRNDNNQFIDIQAGLTGIFDGVAQWADFNNDGALDIFVAGFSSAGGVSKIYRNDGSDIFTDTQAAIPEYTSSSAVVADHDNDGDADILICGYSRGARQSQIYQNDGQFQFTEIAGTGLSGISNGAISWFDYESDGDLDVLLAGFDNNFSRITKLFHNDGQGVFSPVHIFAEGVIFGDLAIADYDNDSRADFILNGSTTRSKTTGVFRNHSQNQNQPPAAPKLGAAQLLQNRITFNWETATDPENAPASLSYNLRVGSEPGLADIIATESMADGRRIIPLLPGNAGQITTRAIQIDNILNYPGIYWSVQSIDIQGAGSVFAEEASFSGKIIAIDDAPFDEGKKAILRWKASSLDHDINFLTSYAIWRIIPDANMSAAHIKARSRTARIAGNTMQREDAWEWIATVPAHRRADYAYTVTTSYDSTTDTSGMHYFVISAQTADPNIFFDSQPDSGYSVDNLAPDAPQQLSGNFNEGNLLLRWQKSDSKDLKTYLIYKGNDAQSAMEEKEIIATTRDTSITLNADALAGGGYFAVAAQDSNDNLSALSNQFEWSVTSVADGDEMPQTFALYQNYPNPFNPTTIIRFQTPKNAHVQIDVYSILGKHVARLLDQQMQPGEHAIEFRGNQMASGAYFYKIQAGSFVQVRKMILLR